MALLMTSPVQCRRLDLMMEVTCVLCAAGLGCFDPQDVTQKLHTKGLNSLNNQAKEHGVGFKATLGDFVHKDCRISFSRSALLLEQQKPDEVVCCRSQAKSFDFKTDCFYCSKTITDKQRKSKKVSAVKTEVITERINDLANCRGPDPEAMMVKGRLNQINSLFAADAVYHRQCDRNFRNRQNLPADYLDEPQKKKAKLGNRKGRPNNQEQETAFSIAVRVLDNAQNDTVTIQILREKMRAQLTQIGSTSGAFTAKHMKRRLLELYGESVIFTQIDGHCNVICFRHTADKILQNVHDSQTKSEAEIIMAAARFISNDINEKKDDKTVYPSQDELKSLDQNLHYLSKNLKMFLSIILGHSPEKQMLVASLGQAIMQHARPRALLAPLQLAVGVQIHHLVESKFLIQEMHKLGFTTSYAEVQKFEKSAAVNQGTGLSEDFDPDCDTLHLHADNVDRTINSLDGKGQVHLMGTLGSVIPGCRKSKEHIPRQAKITVDDLKAVGTIPIVLSDWDGSSMDLAYKNATIPESSPASESQFKRLNVLHDLAWLVSVERPLYSGFMTKAYNGYGTSVDGCDEPKAASFLFLPFLDMDPNDNSCILSVLHYFVNVAGKNGVSPIVTFDKPLYEKAYKLRNNAKDDSELKKIILILGPFHAEMSYVGAVGSLMESTGLSCIMNEIIAPNSVPYIMNGKASHRAFRAHMLVSTALNCNVLSAALKVPLPSNPSVVPLDETGNIELQGDPHECNYDSDLSEDGKDCALSPHSNSQMLDVENEQSEQEAMDRPSAASASTSPIAAIAICDQSSENLLIKAETLIRDVLEGKLRPEDVGNSDVLMEIERRLSDWKAQQSSNRTSKLWLQYVEMIEVLKRHRNSERTGNWTMQLQAFSDMRPYLAAAGHHQYVKAITLFLQDMEHLERDHPGVYLKFLRGHHVIRESVSHYAGQASDIIIERVLMRSLKSIGGLAHGRGWDESQRLTWLLSRPACAEVNHSLQELTDTSLVTSDQHLKGHAWSKTARMVRDEKDFSTIMNSFVLYPPFPEEASLRCITSGIVASSNVNVDNAKAVGLKVLDDMFNQKVDEYSFRISSKAITMAAQPPVTLDGQKVRLDPQLLFQRLSVASSMTDETAKQAAFGHELCSYPPALFDKNLMMRTGQKSELADAIWRQCDGNQLSYEIPVGPTYVLDGGALIHRLPWPSSHITYGSIVTMYTSYVQAKYGQGTTVVFDSYPDHPTTKDAAHQRRAGASAKIGVILDKAATVGLSKKDFMNNKSNITQLIKLLSEAFECIGCRVVHADDDADTLIVDTALKCAETKPTVVVAEDTDVLILLLHHTTSDYEEIVFLPSVKKLTKKKRRVWNIQQVQTKLGDQICQRLLFIHAFSGCDTTSRPYGLGKSAILQKTQKSITLLQQADVFQNVNASREEIISAGDLALRLLFGGRIEESLDGLRFRQYKNKVLKGGSVVKPETLPPTSAATKFHSLRVYHQVMVWKGLFLPAESFGWQTDDDRFVPIHIDQPAAPQDLLKAIFCKCKTNCSNARCTCVKYNLACTDLCSICQGESCNNQIDC